MNGDMLTVIGGPMFAGKTTWLLNHAKTLVPGSYRLFKPGMDTRYAADQVVTHNGERLAAENLDAAAPVFPRFDRSIRTIMIDELNFFHTERLYRAITEQLQKGIRIIGAGLLYDFQRRPFGATLPLAEKADSFVRLYAVCDGCGSEAEYNYRKIADRHQVVLGAAEAYGASCTDCWSTYIS